METGMIFVIGNSRSGTTMMGRILGNHPSIFTFKELHFFEQIWDPASDERWITKDAALEVFARLLMIQREGYLNQGSFQSHLSEAQIALDDMGKDFSLPHIFKKFLAYETLLHNKSISCDQTPRNALLVDELMQEYPDARFIHMVRDPRDVLLSQKNRWKRAWLSNHKIGWFESLRSKVNYHPYILARMWTSLVKIVRKNQLSERLIEVRFEDLVIDPVSHVNRICQFLGIEYNESLLDVPYTGSSHDNDRNSWVGINKSVTCRWKVGGLAVEEIAVCEKICGSRMRDYGYEMSHPKPGCFSLMWLWVKLPLQMLLILLMNFARYKNLWRALGRRFKS